MQNTSHDANWTVCDGVSGTSRAAHSTGVTVIAGRARQPRRAGGHARRHAGGPGRQRQGTSTWLLWDGKRSQIDLADHAVTNALGLGARRARAAAHRAGAVQRDPRSAAADGAGHPECRCPGRLPGAGSDRRGGGVLRSLDQNSSGAVRYYAVLPDGLQPISPVLAAILRNTNSYGLDQPPRLGADAVAKLPVSRMLDTSRYPDQQVSLVDAAKDPVTCAYWSKPAGAATSSLTLLSGSALPVPDSVRTVDLVGGARRQPPASRWRRAPATSPRPWAAAPARPAPGRCSGSPTPGSATASTPRRTARPPDTAKPLRRLA